MAKLINFDKKEKILIDPSSSILVVGSRRSGKTQYSKYLVDQIKDLYSLIILFTHTKSSHQWDNIINSNCIFDEFDDLIIDKIIKRNQILKEHCPDININTLIIFDDIIDDSNLKNDDSIKRIFTAGRWHNIGIIFLTQYLNALSPTSRTNCDIIICCVQNSLQSVEILYDSYGIIDKKQFVELLNNYTKDFSVFIIKNDKNTNVPEIKYQFDKARI